MNDRDQGPEEPHPDWKKLRADPKYKNTVSAITNIMLRPAACSQV